jgi:hypothetical protein
MVEDLAPAASDPSFGGSVLPGGANARPHWFQSGRLQERDNFAIEDAIVIQNGVAIGSRLGKRRSELLHDPFCRRMPSHVEVQDLAALVLDDENSTGFGMTPSAR